MKAKQARRIEKLEKLEKARQGEEEWEEKPAANGDHKSMRIRDRILPV